jgi:hypothetical protein
VEVVELLGSEERLELYAVQFRDGKLLHMRELGTRRR